MVFRKVLIVEDEVIIADDIYEMLEEEHFKNIRIAQDKSSAIAKMKSFAPDIILMDINLNGKNSGIELAKEKNENATIIFITGQNDNALMNEAFKTNPEAYLTKPVKKTDLLASINLAMQKKQNQSIQFKEGYDTVNLQYNLIEYAVAEGNYVNIHTRSKVYTSRQSLHVLLQKLPADLFKQTHRSYFVNTSNIQRITSNTVILPNVEIPLSRTYAKLFK